MENVRDIYGTVMKMDLQGGVVNNYGTIMHLGGSGISLTNNGTIMHNNARTGGERVVYRDRIVYRDRYIRREQDNEKVKQLEAELGMVKEQNRRLARQLNDFKSKDYQTRLTIAEERLSAVISANHEAAIRIKELENGIVDSYLKDQIDAWDMRPTKEMCSRLLKDLKCFIDYEE